MHPRLLNTATLACTLLAVRAARAQPPVSDQQPTAESAPTAQPETNTTAEPPNVVKARAAFAKGAELAANLRWGDALAEFERSQRLRPSPGTVYNVGVCQRALGKYVLARETFREALAQHTAATNGTLPQALLAETNTFIGELDRVISTRSFTLRPASARIAIDGRPLKPVRGAKTTTLLAGVLPAGDGTSPRSANFDVELDPGNHIVRLSRRGFSDVVRRLNVKPGSRGSVTLELKKLPARLRITSKPSRAAVAIDGLDVGLAPLTLSRPAGRYRISVRKDGYVDYNATTLLRPGEQRTLQAPLPLEQTPLTQRWWFWTGVGVAIAGAVLITYAITRPDPERPALSGGGLGWTVEVP